MEPFLQIPTADDKNNPPAWTGNGTDKPLVETPTITAGTPMATANTGTDALGNADTRLLNSNVNAITEADRMGDDAQAAITDINSQPLPAITADPTAGFATGLGAVADAGDYLTPQTSMAWQMDQLTSQDSPMNARAETNAMRQGQALGLLNSQGTQSAMFNNVEAAARPIAQHEADTAVRFGQQQQAADNTMAGIVNQTIGNSNLAAQAGQIAERSAAQNFQNTVNQLDIAQNQQLQRTFTDAGINFDAQRASNAFTEGVTRLGLSDAQARSAANIWGTLTNTYMNEWGNAINNPDVSWTQENSDSAESIIGESMPMILSLFDMELA